MVGSPGAKPAVYDGADDPRPGARRRAADRGRPAPPPAAERPAGPPERRLRPRLVRGRATSPPAACSPASTTATTSRATRSATSTAPCSPRPRAPPRPRCSTSRAADILAAMPTANSLEPDLDRAREIAERGLILRTTVGSVVHGLSNPGTDDRDEMGVCVEPPEYLLGFRRFEHFVYPHPAGGRAERPRRPRPHRLRAAQVLPARAQGLADDAAAAVRRRTST